MKLIILPSADEVADWTAKYVTKKINDFRANENKYFVIGLPTGKFQILYFCRILT